MAIKEPDFLKALQKQFGVPWRYREPPDGYMCCVTAETGCYSQDRVKVACEEAGHPEPTELRLLGITDDGRLALQMLWKENVIKWN